MPPKTLSIDDLPDELLLLIFDELVRLNPPGWFQRRSGSRRVSKLGFITATHVCRRWRRMLLSMPRIWGAVVCNLPEIFEILLDRAGDAPLDINVPADSRSCSAPWGSIIDLVFTRYSSVRSLHCFIPAGLQRQQALSVLSSGTYPRLHRFCIANAPFYTPGVNGHLQEVLYLDAPNLEAASIDNVRCHFTSRHLRSLQLGDIGSAVFEYFIQLLENTPQLEDLCYDIDISNPNLAAAAGICIKKPLHLAHLRRICTSTREYELTSLTTRLIFQFLTFPVACSVHYTTEVFESCLTVAWRSTATTVGHYLRQLPYDAVSFTVHASDSQSFHVNAFYTHECSVAFGQSVASYRLEPTCCVRTDVDRWHSPHLSAPGVWVGAYTSTYRYDEMDWPDGLFISALSYLRHETITHLALSLDLEGFSSVHFEELRRVLCTLSAVEVLFISDIEYPIVQILKEDSVHAQDECLPNLREVIIGQKEAEAWWDPTSLTMWWEDLLLMLRHRKSVDRPVRTMRFNGIWCILGDTIELRDLDNANLSLVRNIVTELCDERYLVSEW